MKREEKYYYCIEKRNMKVTVNGHRVNIFQGATAGDAVLAYSQHSFRRVMSGKLMIYDRFGNMTDPGGALIDGAVIHLKKPGNHE